MCGIALVLAGAGCGGDDDDSADDADGSTTTTEAGDTTTTTESAAPAGDDGVTEEFCAALSADLDGIEAIVNSFESTGSAPDNLVQDAQDANDALEDATPDAVADDASAVYTPLGELLDSLASGDASNIANEYASVVGSSDFTDPLTNLLTQCSTLSTGG
jgi:hypothetical protein